jgi:hypothetical protein
MMPGKKSPLGLNIAGKVEYFRMRGGLIEVASEPHHQTMAQEPVPGPQNPS